MKIKPSIIKYLFILIFFYFLLSCSDVLCPPDNIEIDSGIKGIVTDTLGQPLENVDVFCLYYFSYLPNEVTQSFSLQKTSKIDSFAFNLAQNFPNPFSNSTFLRFSLPDKSSVDFKIINRISNKTVYKFSKELNGGYFQYYLKNIVDSLNLLNGPYSYTLNAQLKDGILYSDKKELFIISDKGRPNSITDSQGKYVFDYRYTFVGDSVIVNDRKEYLHSINLTNSVYLLFKKNGYYPKTIRVTLYPDVVLTNDIILIEE